MDPSEVIPTVLHLNRATPEDYVQEAMPCRKGVLNFDQGQAL